MLGSHADRQCRVAQRAHAADYADRAQWRQHLPTQPHPGAVSGASQPRPAYLRAPCLRARQRAGHAYRRHLRQLPE